MAAGSGVERPGAERTNGQHLLVRVDPPCDGSSVAGAFPAEIRLYCKPGAWRGQTAV